MANDLLGAILELAITRLLWWSVAVAIGMLAVGIGVGWLVWG